MIWEMILEKLSKCGNSCGLIEKELGLIDKFFNPIFECNYNFDLGFYLEIIDLVHASKSLIDCNKLASKKT